jgi:hypothetical protein
MPPVGNNGQVAAPTPLGWKSVDFNLPKTPYT